MGTDEAATVLLVLDLSLHTQKKGHLFPSMLRNCSDKIGPNKNTTYRQK